MEPLAQVSAPLRCLGVVVPPVVSLISVFLDPSLLLSSKQAAARGSVRLFERVASRLYEASMNPIYVANGFAQALEAAIQADDLAMVVTIDRLHPEPLDVPSLTLAMAHGSLPMVQWVFQHRHDVRCYASDTPDRPCGGSLNWAMEAVGDKDIFRIVTWLVENDLLSIDDTLDSCQLPGISVAGFSAAALRVLPKSTELVRWCDAKRLLTPPMIDRVERNALSLATDAALGIASYFFDRGYAPVDAENFVIPLVGASCVSE